MQGLPEKMVTAYFIFTNFLVLFKCKRTADAVMTANIASFCGTTRTVERGKMGLIPALLILYCRGQRLWI